MDEKERILLKLKDRWISGEISEEQYLKMKVEITGESQASLSRDAAFDAKATFRGLGVGSILRDRYEIVSELGRGGMGVVYKARDCELDTIVAVKVLNEELARDGRSVRNLMEEAKISMRLTHPHIMRLINFESDERRKFLVMEYIEGETLEALLGREGKFAEPALIKIAVDICEGLGYAHKQKIIHRDIKPSNIMLTSTGEVKIMDFGIARVMKDSMTMVTGRLTTGTLIYMAPEQIEGRDVDVRSDLYSLGIMLYELASGTPPFYQGDITHQHLKVAPKPLEGVFLGFNEIIQRCLEKEKTKRYGSVEELKAALEGRQEKESDRMAKEAHEKADKESAERERVRREVADRENAAQELRARELGERAKAERKKAERERDRQTEAGRREKEEAHAGVTIKKTFLWKFFAVLIFVGFQIYFVEHLVDHPSEDPSGIIFLEFLILFILVRISAKQLKNSGINRKPVSRLSSGDVQAPHLAPVKATSLQKTEFEMMPIAGGKFLMGSPATGRDSAEMPAHEVEVKGFTLAKYPVTQVQWTKVMANNPSEYPGGELPVENISWQDAREFIDKLNELTQSRFRLPTEAEWEFACRGGAADERYGHLPKIAWYKENSGESTNPVGRLEPNAFGLHDMLGNVWEWVQDWYGPYPSEPQSNPAGPESGEFHIARGGSWKSGPAHVRSAVRYRLRPEERSPLIGFRLAMDL